MVRNNHGRADPSQDRLAGRLWVAQTLPVSQNTCFTEYLFHKAPHCLRLRKLYVCCCTLYTMGTLCPLRIVGPQTDEHPLHRKIACIWRRNVHIRMILAFVSASECGTLCASGTAWLLGHGTVVHPCLRFSVFFAPLHLWNMAVCSA